MFSDLSWLIALTRCTRSCGLSKSGTTSPNWLSTCPKILPPIRRAPSPNCTNTKVVSSWALSCGVNVWRTSARDANALTIKLTGDVTLCCLPSCCHWVRMDKLSLPTGIEIPRAGHNSIPTAYTVSYKAASSPSSPHAAIQLALSLTRFNSIGAANKFVMASAIAIRPDAGALSAANGVRSPMLMASPANPLKSAKVTAQSATGTCQGPTIWSRCVSPPTARSPIVIKNRLLATVG